MTTVLLVDDDVFFLSTTGDVLAKAGFYVIRANGGTEALKMIKTERQKIDIVISDILMPVTDGWSVLYAIKSDPVLFVIPVILVSVDSTGVPISRAGKFCNADATMPKPLHFPELIQLIKALTKK